MTSNVSIGMNSDVGIGLDPMLASEGWINSDGSIGMNSDVGIGLDPVSIGMMDNRNELRCQHRNDQHRNELRCQHRNDQCWNRNGTNVGIGMNSDVSMRMTTIGMSSNVSIGMNSDVGIGLDPMLASE